MKKVVFIFSILLALTFTNKSFAQLDSTLNLCRSHLKSPYISDGQSYTSLINGNEIAEFYATFYGKTTYRVVGYSGTEAGNLIFSVYDMEHNLLFTNNNYQNSPYWNLEFDHTMDCIIEAKLDTKNITSGIAVMQIGFVQ